MRRLWLILVCAICAIGCSSTHRVQLGEVALADVMYTDQTDIPQYLTLVAEVENQGGAIKIRSCSFSIYYKWRKIAILKLEQGVKIPAQSSDEVLLPLHVVVARNSQTLPLRKALERGDMSNVQISWEAKVRRGVVGMKLEQEAEPITKVLSDSTISRIVEIFSSEE